MVMIADLEFSVQNVWGRRRPAHALIMFGYDFDKPKVNGAGKELLRAFDRAKMKYNETKFS